MPEAVTLYVPTTPPARSGGVLLRAVLWGFYLLLAAPLAGLVVLALSGGGAGIGWSAGLAATMHETLVLLLGVGLLSAAMGVGAAWLIAMYRFPGRDLMGVLLVLPLALPTYLAAYIIVELTDYFGPVQGAVRALFGFTSRRDYWFPEVRSLPGAVITLSLVLYPYIYLPARLMFERQANRIIYAARLHGAHGARLFFRVGLPLARPAIAGGTAFALLETLNDVGAVEHFGIQTLSLTIRSIWLNRGSLPGAAQVSLGALVLVMGILLAEYALRRHSAFANTARGGALLTPKRLSGLKAGLAGLGCFVPVALGFLIPVVFMIFEAWRLVAKGGLQPELFDTLANSLLLSSAAGVLVAMIGACIALAARLLRGPLAHFAPRFATLGYAIPGSVLVIALLPVIGLFDEGAERMGLRIVLSGSMAAILLAYVLRFTGIGIAQAEASLTRLSVNIDHAARTLGAGNNRLAFEVLAPNITRGIGLAALFAFVDAMKELPATLLLRPLNMETLATSLYAHASGGTFENGAVEALLLFVVGLIPVLLLARLR